MPNRLTIDEVRSFLRKQTALIVHFSGTPGGMDDQTIFYPMDLLAVSDGAAQSGICCSVVLPGDNFEPKMGPSMAFGKVGLILDLQNEASLAVVSHEDWGSRVEDGKRIYEEQPTISVDTLTSSIEKRETHNEWILKDYIVRGIFVVEPFEVWVEEKPALELPVVGDDEFPLTVIEPPTAGPGLQNRTLDEISQELAGVGPIYTYKDGEIVSLHPLEEGPVDPVKIYPE